MPRDPMALSLLLAPIGTHIAAWRHPDAPTHRTTEFAYYRDIARAAERACYDLLFVADSLYLDTQARAMERRHPRHAHLELEPLTLLSALAVVTEKIGLAATISTTYSSPFTVARAMASLDHLSGGRAGWNVVTSRSNLEAGNYGLAEHAEHGERYARATEYVDVVQRLWDSWGDNALVDDRPGGVAIDPGRIHRLGHRGEHYAVEGPLNVPRPPQGHPLVIQAGSSGPGQDLAARTADLVFTAVADKESAGRFYRSIKDRLPACGRDERSLLVMPGVFAIVGETDAEARAKFDALQDLVDPAVGLALLGDMLGGVDLSGVDIDQPLPPVADGNASRTQIDAIRRLGADARNSVREIYLRLAPARGHLTLVGAAEHVADTLADWHADGAADGFMLVPGVMPEGQRDFDRLVLPILRDRGLARSAYRGDTLREHLGLARPPSRFDQGQLDR